MRNTTKYVEVRTAIKDFEWINKKSRERLVNPYKATMEILHVLIKSESYNIAFLSMTFLSRRQKHKKRKKSEFLVRTLKFIEYHVLEF